MRASLPNMPLCPRLVDARCFYPRNSISQKNNVTYPSGKRVIYSLLNSFLLPLVSRYLTILSNTPLWRVFSERIKEKLVVNHHQVLSQRLFRFQEQKALSNGESLPVIQKRQSDMKEKEASAMLEPNAIIFHLGIITGSRVSCATHNLIVSRDP